MNFFKMVHTSQFSVKNAIVWDVTPSSVVQIHVLGEPAALNVQLAGSSETMNSYLGTQFHIPEQYFPKSLSQ